LSSPVHQRDHLLKHHLAYEQGEILTPLPKYGEFKAPLTTGMRVNRDADNSPKSTVLRDFEAPGGLRARRASPPPSN